VDLSASDKELLKGHKGPAMQMAMELVLQAGRILGAQRLVPITYAHLDACFYNKGKERGRFPLKKGVDSLLKITFHFIRHPHESGDPDFQKISC
jgi:predicted aconitase